MGTVALIGSQVQAVAYSLLLVQSIATVSFSARLKARVLTLPGKNAIGRTPKLVVVSAQKKSVVKPVGAMPRANTRPALFTATPVLLAPNGNVSSRGALVGEGQNAALLLW